MYIRGLYIDGFGVFHDVSVGDLPPGLAVFVGGNESGKSTLTEFFRYILFGPPANDARKLYPPARGGRLGGRLDVTLQDDQSRTIERNEWQVTVSEADGTVGEAEPCRSFLGEIERSIFQRVFAIGQENLEGTHVIHEQDIRSRLTTASSGPGERLLPGVLEGLEQRTVASLQRRGAAHEAAACQDRLAELRREIAALRGQASEFAIAERERADLLRKVEQQAGRSEQIGRQLERLEQLQNARGHWIRWKQRRETAWQLAHARGFPPSGLRRFDALQDEIEDATALADVSRGQLEQIHRQMAEITLDRPLLDARPAIEQLLGERESLTTAVDELSRARATCEQRRDEYERRLNDLGPGWDRQRLAGFDTSLQTRQQADDYARQLNQARAEVETAGARARSLQPEFDRACAEESEVRRRADLLPTPSEHRPEIVEARLAAAVSLQPLLHERELLSKRDRARQAAYDDLAVQLAGVTSQLAVGGGILPAWFVVVAAVLGGAVAAIAAVAGARLLGAVVLVIAAALTGSLVQLRRRQRTEQADRRRQLLALQQRLAGRQQDLAQEEIELRRQDAAVRAQLGETATAAEIDVPANLAELEQVAIQASAQREELANFNAAQQQLNAARDRVESVTAELNEARRKQRQAEAELQLKCADWQRWLAQRVVAATTSPEEFDRLWEAVSEARRALRDYEDAQQVQARIEDRIACIRRQLEYVLRQCGRDHARESDELAVIDKLSEDLAQAIETNREFYRLDEIRQDFELEQGRLQRQVVQKRKSLRRLLEAAGVDDEEAFRRAAEDFRLWQGCKQAADEEEIALRTIAGTQAAWPELERQLDRTPPDELDQQRERLAAELKQTKASLAADERQFHARDAELRRMTGDDRLGERLREQAKVKARLDDAVRNWAVKAVCCHLLSTARETSERERQPQVMRLADEYLDIMTAGRYRFAPPRGEAAIVLENADRARKEETTWSSGAADQASLAIRLALARELARHGEPLPVILDDVLVRFDPERRRDAVRTLLHFAAHQQVILLSCRDDLTQLVEQVHQQDNLNHVAVAYYDVDGGKIRPRPGIQEAARAPRGVKVEPRS